MRTLLFLPLLVQAERLHTQSFSPEIKRTYKTHHQTSQKNHGRSTDSQLQQATINTQDQAAENYFQSLGIEYQIKNQYSTQHNGMRHAHGVQTVNGISIANTAIGVTISREGNIITSYNSVWEQQTGMNISRHTLCDDFDDYSTLMVQHPCAISTTCFR